MEVVEKFFLILRRGFVVELVEEFCLLFLGLGLDMCI